MTQYFNFVVQNEITPTPPPLNALINKTIQGYKDIFHQPSAMTWKKLLPC